MQRDNYNVMLRARVAWKRACSVPLEHRTDDYLAPDLLSLSSELEAESERFSSRRATPSKAKRDEAP